MARRVIQIARAALLGAAIVSAGCAPPPVEFARIPGGEYRVGSREPWADNPPRTVVLPPFDLGRYEITAAQFAEYLTATGARPRMDPHPDLKRRGQRWVPAYGKARHPIASITRDEAEAYCRWLQDRLGRACRLPTQDEWEAAARGGVDGGPWPWGWGDPRGRMVWGRRSASPVGSCPPNGYGLYDMAGNVFEWCAGQTPDGGIPARGGAWSETDAHVCVVHRVVSFRPDYMDADVGFRVAADASASVPFGGSTNH